MGYRNKGTSWFALSTVSAMLATTALAQVGGSRPKLTVRPPAGVITPSQVGEIETTVRDEPVQLTADGRIHLFLQLEDEPAAQVFARTNQDYQARTRFVVRGGAAAAEQQASRQAATEAISYSRSLESKQTALVSRLTSAEFGAEVLFRGQTAINGIAVLISPEQRDALALLPGVKRVVALRGKKPMANTSVEYMGTRNFWDPARLNGLGDGVGVVVIDTGIDFIHTAFGGPGLNNGTATGYSQGRTTIDGTSAATTFPTAKVIWGWDLVGDAYNGGFATPPVTVPSPDPNPMDVNGHGTACGSLAVGFGTLTTGATYTGNYNATEPQITGTGNAMRTSPGIAPKSALYGLRVFGNAGATFISSQAVDIATAVRIWQLSPEGTPLPPILAGLTGAAPIPRTPVLAIASMSLGDDAGYDYVGDPDTDSANNANVAGLSIIAAAGNAYDNYYNAGTPANATAALSVAASYNGQGTQVADSMAAYSSRGPRPSDSKLKPDITGPAEAVSAASVNTGSGNRTFNGTSSATPHVAGAMALLRQYRPTGYTAEDYKALMMNSVRVEPRVSATGLFYGISRIGNGRITLNPGDNFPTALAMSTDPDAPVSVSFGLLNIPVAATQTFEKTVRVVNKEAFARTFAVSFNDGGTTPNVSAPGAVTPGATYSLPDGNAVNVPANGQTTLRVRLTVVGSQLRHARDAQTAAVQGTPARNYVSEAAGRLLFTEQSGLGHSMRLSVHSVVRPTSSLSLASGTTLAVGPSPTTQTLSLAGTGINTGPNTATTAANNPADIVSHAKGFEWQYRQTTFTGTFYELSEVENVGVTSDFARRAIPYDSTATNNQSAVVVFAVTTRKDYAIPGELGTQVRILIDRDRTGATNLVLRNYTSNTSTAQNVYLTGTSPTAANVSDGATVTSTGYYANITTGIPSNILNNNVAMLPVNFRQLGLTAANPRFNYKVQVTRHDGLGYSVNTETPWLTYDPTRPGVDASVAAGVNEPFVLNGQPNQPVSVALNQANMQGNGSLGLLMLYPHNAPGNRVQAVPVSVPANRLYVGGFSPSTGVQGTQVTLTGSGFTGATAVAFKGVPATQFTVNNDSTITVVVPAGASTSAISVATPAGRATSPTRFQVNQVP